LISSATNSGFADSILTSSGFSGSASATVDFGSVFGISSFIIESLLILSAS